ncbi:MAG TPA: GNAT family N-acetyltransferase, partial [Pseudonocardiaceae bacterium]|nr:GNAT family N-acetyltransferase [Pseudonocardiaceae bacterium]
MIYALLRLRVEVFIVEQRCPYQDLDGHDLHQTTRHYWLAPYGAIEDAQATLRLLEPTEGQFKIGRVCAARSVRAQGAVRRLLEAALAEVGDAPCLLDAQTDSVGFYAEFGFVVEGAEFTEDGVPHVLMRRAGSARVR